MNALVIHNPWAGPAPAKAVVQRAVAYWRGLGWQVRVAETAGPGSAAQWARQAAESSLDTVIVAGGDGTLGQAASGLAGSQTALGLLALGTANVWARDLGLPILTGRGLAAAEKAAAALAGAAVRFVDVGEVGQRKFLLWFGAGLDGHIVGRIEPRSRAAKLLGMPYYVAAAFVAAAGWRGRPQTVSVDGESLTTHALITLVGNTRSYGGGLFLASPEARLDDGRFEVLVFHGKRYSEALAAAWSLFQGRHRADPRISLFSGREITVTSPILLPCQIDAEPLPPRREAQIIVKPRSLKILVPDPVSTGMFSHL